jgi:hypothetical protein
MTLDGNYELHIQNGGCPSTHPGGRLFCQGSAGHYNYVTSKHFAPTINPRYGTDTVEWVGA